MKMLGHFILFSLLWAVTLAQAADNTVFFHPQTSVRLSVQHWKALKDARIVKQQLDYSCGAAALATLLNEFYGQHVTEEALLKEIDKDGLWSSFADMQSALKQFGFRAQGYAASYEQLARLKIPVILYLEHRRNSHFTVLRGINEHAVWLADPSQGNRTYSKAQFLKMWETRSEDQNTSELTGKFLAVLPENTELVADQGFFSRNPKRQSAPAVRQLSIRIAR